MSASYVVIQLQWYLSIKTTYLQLSAFYDCFLNKRNYMLLYKSPLSYDHPSVKTFLFAFKKVVIQKNCCSSIPFQNHWQNGIQLENVKGADQKKHYAEHLGKKRN